MSSVSEKGYAMVAAHFDELLEAVLTIKYEPSPERLKIEFMKVLSGNYKTVLNDLNKTLAAFRAAVDAREPAFEVMNRLASRIMNILKSLNLPEETIETCKQIVRKILGQRAKPKRSLEQIAKDAAAGIEIREISSSQRSYDNQLANFIMLYEQLNNIPDFTPNETELKKETIKMMIDDLRRKNEAVVSARAAIKDARAKRDNLLNKKGTGLVDVARDAKAYIKGAFGPSSSEFKKVQKLEFSKN